MNCHYCGKSLATGNHRLWRGVQFHDACFATVALALNDAGLSSEDVPKDALRETFQEPSPPQPLPNERLSRSDRLRVEPELLSAFKKERTRERKRKCKLPPDKIKARSIAKPPSFGERFLEWTDRRRYSDLDDAPYKALKEPSYRSMDREPTMTTDTARFINESFTHQLRAIDWNYYLHV